MVPKSVVTKPYLESTAVCVSVLFPISYIHTINSAAVAVCLLTLVFTSFEEISIVANFTLLPFAFQYLVTIPITTVCVFKTILNTQTIRLYQAPKA